MISIDNADPRAGYCLILVPNCSISRRQLGLFYGATCLLAATIGLFFLHQGAWIILPLSGLEMLALGTGLYLTSRQLQQRQVITLRENRILVEKTIVNRIQCWDFERAWIRLNDQVVDAGIGRRKLELGSHGRYVEVGEFLSDFEKDQLAFQLKGCIILA